MYAKHQRSHNRHTLRVVTIAAGLIIALGYAGHIDYQSALVEQASGYCQTASLDSSTTPTLAQCINNQLEQNGDK